MQGSEMPQSYSIHTFPILMLLTFANRNVS